jgi:uncharacterized protein (TIGR02217 family)
MSTSVLTTPIGLGWDVVRTPIWDTIVQQVVSGKETRLALQSYPRWEWQLTFDVVRSDATNHEFQDLVGFFNARQGMFDSFLYQDADDNSVTSQNIGTGNGSNLLFQLVRSFGGFTEPVLAPHTVSHVYVNGVDQAGNWTVSNWGTTTPGLITFAGGHAPGNGLAVTADFTYYWPVRMTMDSVPFNMFVSKFYGVKKFTFESLKN